MMTRCQSQLTRLNPTTWVLKLSGTIEHHHLALLSSPKTDDNLATLLQADPHTLIIDLTATERFGSQGIQYLILLHKRLPKWRVQLLLGHPDDHLAKLIHILQLHHLFEVKFTLG